MNSWILVLVLLLLVPSSAIAQNTEVAKLTASDGAEDDRLGRSVSLSGERALVGAHLDDDGGTNSGAAYLYERQSDGTWIESAKLAASDAASGDEFGRSVALSGDYALIGAPFSGGTNSGAAYLYERQSDGTWIESAKLEASEASENLFAISVSLTRDYALVGASVPESVSGAAYIYERQGDGTWIEAAKLEASDFSYGDDFGSSVALSGDYALIGAPGIDDASTGTRSGLAYLYERQNDGTWIEAAKLEASDAAAYNQFGYSVALSSQLALVGAIGGDFNNNVGGKLGTAYLYERQNDGTWIEVTRLEPADATMSDLYGLSLSISETHVLVGAPGYDAGGTDIGSVYVYERQGEAMWVEVDSLAPSDLGVGDNFGASVSISGDLSLVGSWFHDDRVFNSGAAYVFQLESSGSSYQPPTVLTAPFTDNFDDNTIDPEKWTYSGSRVVEQDNVMKVEVTETDNGGRLESGWIRISTGKSLKISQKSKIHYANEYFAGRLDVMIEGMPDRTFGVSYANYSYEGGNAVPTYGIHLFRNAANEHNTCCQDDVSEGVEGVWDRWFTEELIYDPQTGRLQYFIDGSSAISYNVGAVPDPDSINIKLAYAPWGWYTGHYMYLDDLLVRQIDSGTYGTTVIVHGHRGGLDLVDNGIDKDQEWTLTMAQAVAKRAGGGILYEIGCGDLASRARSGCGGDIVKREDLSIGPVYNEAVIVFDWLEESNDPVEGYAEASADVLAARLVDGALKGLWSLDQLHFIGHSRGTVVSSEAIQRLGYYDAQNWLPNGVRVDPAIHFTALDPHPWDNKGWDDIGDDPRSARDHHVNQFSQGSISFQGDDNSTIPDDETVFGVVCWDNVAYCESYWQDDSDVHGDDGFIVDLGDYKNLSGMEEILGAKLDANFILTPLKQMSHSNVHVWYHGTINTEAENDDYVHPDTNLPDHEDSKDILVPDWYPELGWKESGETVTQTNDFSYTRTTAGYNRARAVGSLGIDFIETDVQRLYTSDWTIDNRTNVFNGDFSFGNINDDPGWEIQGGGGTGDIIENGLELVGGIVLRLGNRVLTLDNNQSLEHNWLLVPKGHQEINFWLSVPKRTDGDILNVYLIDETGEGYAVLDNQASGTTTVSQNPVLIGSIPLLGEYNDYRPERIPFLASGLDGKVWKLKFELASSTSTGSNIKIDDVGFTLRRTLAVSMVASATSVAKTSTTAGLPQLHVYDPAGNHAGPISGSEIENGILGSYMVQTVEEDGSVSYQIALTPLPEGQEYRFEIIGNGGGNASFAVRDQTEGNSAKTAVFALENIAPGAKAEVSLRKISDQVQLSLDENGDGTPDKTLAPTQYTESFSINVVPSTNGKVSVSPDPIVDYGESVALEVTPDPGYQVNDVLVNGESIGAVESYTIENVQRDYVVEAVFIEADANVCSITRLAEEISRDPQTGAGQVTATFTNPDGIEALTFSLLENFTVTAPSLTNTTGNRWETTGSPQEVTVTLTQADRTVADAAYYAVVESVCPTEADGTLETDFDPPYAFEALPERFALESTYPNPFNPSTTIVYTVPEAAEVTLAVYDVLGREVTTLVQGRIEAGRHEVSWEAGNVAGGVYLIRLQAGGHVDTHTVTLLK